MFDLHKKKSFEIELQFKGLSFFIFYLNVKIFHFKTFLTLLKLDCNRLRFKE